MKYLSTYMEDQQTALFEKLGVFFAFSTEQFNEGKKEGVKYCDAGGGMLCPVGNEKELVDELDRIYKECIQQDLSENGREGVIKRELSNHECYYTGDIDDCVDKLKDYSITTKEIRDIFNKEWATNA